MESTSQSQMASPALPANNSQMPTSFNPLEVPSPPAMEAASWETVEALWTREPSALDTATILTSRIEKELSSPLSPVHSQTPEMSFPTDTPGGFIPINRGKPGVSSLLTPTSTPVSAGRPRVNDQSYKISHPWTEDETVLLRTWGPLADAHGIAWDWIATTKFQDRTGRQCADRWKSIKSKKGAGQVEEIAIKLEDPPTDITPEMLPPSKKTPALSPESYDEMWELGLSKYRDEGVTWSGIADQHSASWITSAEHSDGAAAANICARWTSLFDIKMRQWKDGVFLFAVRSVGQDMQTPVSNLDPTDFTDWPEALLKRIQGHDKRRKGGAASLAARFSNHNDSDSRSAKRQKCTASPLAVMSNTPGASVYSKTAIEWLPNPSLQAKPIETLPDSVHTTFTKQYFGDLKCPECKQTDGKCFNACQRCDAVLCQQCLESGRVLTHRLPTDNGDDLSAVDQFADLETQDSVGLAQRLQQEECEASHMRTKRERAAKTKAIEQSRQSMLGIEEMLGEPLQESPEHTKRSSPAKRGAPPKQATEGYKYAPGGKGSGGRIKLDNDSQAPSPKTRTKQPVRTLSLDIRKKHKVTKRYVDGGSSSEFDEDEIVRSPAIATHKYATASPVPKNNNANGGAPRKFAPHRRGSPAHTDFDSDSDDDSLVSPRQQKAARSTRSNLPDDSTDTSDGDGEAEARRPTKIVKLKYLSRSGVWNRPGKACAECFQAQTRCTHSSEIETQSSMNTNADRAANDNRQTGHETFGSDRGLSDTGPSRSRMPSARDGVRHFGAGQEDGMNDRGSRAHPPIAPNLELIATPKLSQTAATHADMSPRETSPQDKVHETSRSSYASGMLSKSQTPMSLAPPADTAGLMDTDDDTDEDAKDAEFAKALAEYEREMEKHMKEQEEANRDWEDHKRRERLRRQEKYRAQEKVLDQIRQKAEESRLAAQAARDRNLRLGISRRQLQAAELEAGNDRHRMLEWP